MTRISVLYEKIDHYPEWPNNVYNKMHIPLSTYSKNAVTEKDFELTKAIESILKINGVAQNWQD